MSAPKNKAPTPANPSGDFGKPADTYGLKSSNGDEADKAPSAPSSFDQKTYQPKEKSHADTYGLKKSSSSSPSSSSSDSSSQRTSSGQDKDKLPHSKKVRGTLANTSGQKVNKTQLGDPASLTAETSETNMAADTERGSAPAAGEGDLRDNEERRKDVKRNSKL
jgi:hypothetical protein